MPSAGLQTGNGITLCRECHAEPHRVFNRRPDITLPVDAEGGEQLGQMALLFGALLEDANSRGILSDRYYFLSDEVLLAFRRMQTIPDDAQIIGPRFQQAYVIWNQAPTATIVAVIRANLGLGSA